MTITPAKFDTIRPFDSRDLPAVFDRLLADPQFLKVVDYVMPGVPLPAVEARMRECRSGLDFQKTFVYGFIERLLSKASLGITFDHSAISADHNYTFVSNHRDIVLDSALLSKLILDAGFPTTCEIAIGDNLLRLPWVKDVARLCKAFIVERDLPMRELLMASKRLSEYMHFAISEKKENIWIAQREGRAKDSDDRTQSAILKMMALAGDGDTIDRLKALHIVPLAISYEYDPCDYLKAGEMQQRRDNEHFHKGPMDDVVSMQTGIMGYKGHIYYHAAPCLDRYLDNLDPQTPKTELFEIIAQHIDCEIHSRYHLYPNNYIALDELRNTTDHTAHYTADEKQAFSQYIDSRLQMIDVPQKDELFLRRMMLTMYANPAINYLRTL